MSVQKITWQNLIVFLNPQEILTSVLDKIEDIDDILNGEDISTSMLKELSEYVINHHLKPFSQGSTPNPFLIWKDLPIFVSSWRRMDQRFILLLKNKMREYVLFYEKILTDSGVQRALVYSKSYENDGNASSVERGTDSSTPQNSNLYDSEHPESDSKFDQAIADYASAINKSKASSLSHSEGGSTTNVTGTTWEEGKKNLQLMFYNELKEYIMSIPDRIYSYYSLDTIPAPFLYKSMIEHLDNIKELLESDE